MSKMPESRARGGGYVRQKIRDSRDARSGKSAGAAGGGGDKMWGREATTPLPQ